MAPREQPVRLEVTADELVVELRGWRRLLALQRGVRVPLASITAVAHDPYPRSRVPVGLRRTRARQTPGLFRYGSYHGVQGWSFWAVGSGKGALVVECDHGRYRYLVVEVPDPTATLAAIEAARARATRAS
ncbi:hypothetical protein ACFFRE_00635 [Aciditerrimonas ferrireducens]|jgi:hypothetical protein|uniref:Bacterial Pleckstrin homology domain-containing protein n=1 Tax=Aciditerrimonas ferrireducens TaxID=667306 RepID=A0ABV6BYZ9_9ACTN|nr:hypothetical protein [Aciditerrimonas ferrireducens]MCK4176875.1 hypothetical protein [Aciditerrimonas ferrireducens]